MACIVTFDNTSTGLLSADATNTGVWEYIGYSTTVGGSYGAGGNWPNTSPNWADIVDTSNVDTGFYKFIYKADLDPLDPCYGEIEVIIPVVQGTTEVGANVTINLCSGDAVRTLSNDVDLIVPTAVNGVSVTVSGNGFVAPGYTAGGVGYTDDTYNPASETSYPVTRVFTFTFAPNVPAGYTSSGCDNCGSKTVTLTYVVSSGFSAGTPQNKTLCNN